MKYKLQDLIDIEHFQILQDRLNKIYSFPSAIIDNEGNILTATAWQDVCVKFHRQHKESAQACIQSDRYILTHLHEASPAVTYQCPHGLVDNATPIIIDGIHYGNFFTGQFFLKAPDLDYFKAQARKYGFDEDAYLEAVKKVPIWTPDQLNNYLFFIKGLIEVISESGLKKLNEIEHRKRIEASAKRHISILKSAMDGYWLTDIEGRLLEVNDTYCVMSGYSEHELLTMRIMDIEVIEEPPLITEHMRNIISKGSDRFQSKHRRKDGSIFDVEVSVQYRPEEGGQCICFLRDITESKQAEDALKESEIKLRAIYDNSRDAIGVSIEGWHIAVNPAYIRLFGYDSRNDLVGRPIFDLIAPGCRDEISERIRRRSIDLPVPSAYETRGLKKDGTEFEMEVTASSYKLHGRVNTLVILRDISERKRAEETLRVRLRLMQLAPRVSTHDLLRATLDEVCKLTDSSIGFYHFVEPDQKTITLQAWSSRTTEEFCKAEGQGLHYDMDRAGVWVDCVREGRPVIHNDYASLSHKKGLPPGHAPVIRQLVTPTYRNDRIVAILGVGNKPKEYDEQDSELVQYLADVAWEVVQRKQADEEQKTNLLRQKLAMELAELVHWEYDVTADLFTFNDNFYKLYGTTADLQGGYQMSSQDYSKRFLPPEEVPLVVKAIEQAIASTDPNFLFQTEHRILRPDGQERFISVRFAIIKDNSGRTIKTYGANQDITRRKLAEEELRLSEEKFTKAFKSSPVWVSLTTVADGRFLEVNDAFTNITGYSRGEAIGRTSYDLNFWLNPSDRQRAMEIFSRDGRFRNLEMPMRYKDGKVHTMLWSVDPLRFEGQDCLINVLVDISELKQAQEEKAKLSDQLRQAQKMEAIGTLAGGIAHDFNNILGAIMGYAEMAHDDALRGKADPADLGQIMASAERAKQLVRQILAFSRKSEPDLQALDLNRIVTGTVAILQRTLPKMIYIRTDLESQLPLIQADPTQMEQVLLNLAGNAGDAMPEGGRITIETRTVELDHDYCVHHLEVRPGSYVLLQFSDTGQGMDSETREHIFEPFFTTKELGKGTGLGLSTAYGIVKSHGGHIYCESKLDQGTIFKLYFPVYHKQMAATAEEAERENKEAFRGYETILLVDDEFSLRRLGRRTLENMGYQVLTAQSGEEALTIYRDNQQAIDLIILDLGMPGMGGQKALRAILEIHPQTKVIIASGYAADVQVKAAMELGAVGYVGKPFKKADLLATVRSVLDRK